MKIECAPYSFLVSIYLLQNSLDNQRSKKQNK